MAEKEVTEKKKVRADGSTSEEEKAAVKLEAMARGRKARQEVRKMRAERDAKAATNAADEAAEEAAKVEAEEKEEEEEEEE